MKHLKHLLCLVFAVTAFCMMPSHAQKMDNLTVLVKYKTLPGKDSLGLSALKNLVDKVKKEPNYVNIIIHVDPIDKSNILLYEQWSSEDYYKGDHMKTPHLQQFMIEARAFLGGPPEITFWRIES